MKKAVLNLNRLSNLEIPELAKRIFTGMKDNPSFPTPPESLADLQTQAEECERLYNLSRSRDIAMMAAYHAAIEKLKTMLRDLPPYINSIAKGDVTIIISSSCPVSKDRVPATIPAPVLYLLAAYSRINKTISLEWPKALYSLFYVIEMSTNINDPESWVLVNSLSGRKALVDNLATGKQYWFRVAGCNNKGKGIYSDPVSMIAA